MSPSLEGMLHAIFAKNVWLVPKSWVRAKSNWNTGLSRVSRERSGLDQDLIKCAYERLDWDAFTHTNEVSVFLNRIAIPWTSTSLPQHWEQVRHLVSSPTLSRFGGWCLNDFWEHEFKRDFLMWFEPHYRLLLLEEGDPVLPCASQLLAKYSCQLSSVTQTSGWATGFWCEVLSFCMDTLAARHNAAHTFLSTTFSFLHSRRVASSCHTEVCREQTHKDSPPANQECYLEGLDWSPGGRWWLRVNLSIRLSSHTSKTAATSKEHVRSSCRNRSSTGDKTRATSF